MTPEQDIVERDEAIRKVVGLCNRVPGSTTYNAAEWMYDELAAAITALRAERDEAKAELETVVKVYKIAQEQLDNAIRERDEARKALEEVREAGLYFMDAADSERQSWPVNHVSAKHRRAILIPSARSASSNREGGE